MFDFKQSESRKTGLSILLFFPPVRIEHHMEHQTNKCHNMIPDRFSTHKCCHMCLKEHAEKLGTLQQESEPALLWVYRFLYFKYLLKDYFFLFLHITAISCYWNQLFQWTALYRSFLTFISSNRKLVDRIQRVCKAVIKANKVTLRNLKYETYFSLKLFFLFTT